MPPRSLTRCYVQERTDETDAQCEAAKAAWDALTDEQKAMVEGRGSRPSSTSRPLTASAMRPRTIPATRMTSARTSFLVRSTFGTSYNDSRVNDIKSIEDALQEAYPDWSVRRAFTAQIIINHIQARDGEKIDNMTQALDRAVANGVKNLVVQPTHLMHGAEYDEMCATIDEYRDQFEVRLHRGAPARRGRQRRDRHQRRQGSCRQGHHRRRGRGKRLHDSLEAAKEAGAAFVFMGHGTAHVAKVSYSQMSAQTQNLGYENVFIGTVEGEPEETSCEVRYRGRQGRGLHQRHPAPADGRCG